YAVGLLQLKLDRGRAGVGEVGKGRAMKRFSLLPLIAAMGLIVSAQSANEMAQISSLLQVMQSPQLSTREQAFYKLYALPHAANAPGVGNAMAKLLGRELVLYHSHTVGGEGFANYLGALGDVVLLYAQSSDDPAALRELVQLPANPGSLASVRLAKFGEKLFPALQAAITDGDFTARATSLDIVGIQLARDYSGAQPLPDVRAQLRAMVEKALKDSDAAIRFTAIVDLETIGDPNDIPKLEAIAAIDPSAGIRDRAGRAAINIQMGRKRH
ncbi:MAG: HEAT repeat domain-containing protein, partial [Bryobacteraceae bacterium]